LNNSIKNLINNFSNILATSFGIGLIPFAPGTIATLFAGLIWFSIPNEIFYNSFNREIYYPAYFYLSGIALLMFLIGVLLTKNAEKKYGHDHGCIVFDELFGYLISVLFLPKTLQVAIYAFVLFRVFDITKLYPIKQIQKLPHGWGIMTDDFLAGIYTNVIIQILNLVYPNFFK
jgi:phosphatidylglycerophosphatase A